MTAPAVSSTPNVKVAVTESVGTEYVILRFNDDSDGYEWGEHGDHVLAASPSQAIRKHVAKFPEKDQAGTFLAIPARSFKPVTVKTETVTTLKLEEAK